MEDWSAGLALGAITPALLVYAWCRPKWCVIDVGDGSVSSLQIRKRLSQSKDRPNKGGIAEKKLASEADRARRGRCTK